MAIKPLGNMIILILVFAVWAGFWPKLALGPLQTAKSKAISWLILGPSQKLECNVAAKLTVDKL